MSKRFGGAATLLAVLVIGGCGSGAAPDKSGGDAAGEPVELVLAHHNDSAQHVQAWANAVERLSGGSVTVTVKTSWRADETSFERSTLRDVRDGEVALASISARAFDESGVTSFQPLVAPLLIDSREVEDAVLRSDVGRKALAGADELGLVGLALVPTEMRRPFGLLRPLVAPEDWRGARVYAREGAVAAQTLSALGAQPVNAATGDWMVGVDGAEIGMSAVRNPEAARSGAGLTANVVLWPQPLAIVVNRERFAALSDDQQAALRQAGGEAIASQTSVVNATSREDLQVVCRLGTKLTAATQEQLQALRAAVEPVYDAIERGKGNAEAIRRIEALKADTAPDTASCSADSSRRAEAGAAGALSGTYETKFDRRELEDSPLLMDAGEINDENWGVMRFTFEDGRVRLTQRNAKTSSEMSGTYSTDGDVLTLDMASSGETFVMRWSLYRGRLALKRDEALGIAPTPFVMQPFRRVG